MDSDPLTILLEEARSPSYKVRADAASGLATQLDSERAAQAMLSLLRDVEDTAVGEAAVRALLARGEPVAADLVFEAVATAVDDVADHLLFFVAREHARGRVTLPLRGLARDRATRGRGPIQGGAMDVLDTIGGE